MFSYFNDIMFAEKHWFWLLCILPAMLIWYIIRLKKNESEINYSSFHLLKNTKQSLKAKFRHSLFALRLIAFALLITALARPQSRSSWKDQKTEGIDIVISMDLSLSMLAKDFKPNRMEVAKDVILDFIDARPNDRIGLVTFGGVAFTQCPLTSDHKVLKNMFPQIKAGSLDQGTAIGLGLANAFVAKYNADGGIEWARMLGGSYTSGFSISLDDELNVYYISNMNSGTIDVDPGAGEILYTNNN